MLLPPLAHKATPLLSLSLSLDASLFDSGYIWRAKEGGRLGEAGDAVKLQFAKPRGTSTKTTSHKNPFTFPNMAKCILTIPLAQNAAWKKSRQKLRCRNIPRHSHAHTTECVCVCVTVIRKLPFGVGLNLASELCCFRLFCTYRSGLRSPSPFFLFPPFPTCERTYTDTPLFVQCPLPEKETHTYCTFGKRSVRVDTNGALPKSAFSPFVLFSTFAL